MLDPEENQDTMAMLDSSTEIDGSGAYATPVVSGAMDTFPTTDAAGSYAVPPTHSGGGATSSPLGMFPCFSIVYYQPYFNVDTTDVKDRLVATLLFFKMEPTFLNLIGDAPDLYGPFWIASTLIFVVAVTSNFAKSLKGGLTYDFELVTTCLTLVYGYASGLPCVLWAVVKYWLQLQQVGLTQLACLVGYSFVWWYPAACASTASALSWPALALSCAASTLFLLRSLRPIFESRREKGASVVGALVVLQVLFMLFLKFMFYSHKDQRLHGVAAVESSVSQ